MQTPRTTNTCAHSHRYSRKHRIICVARGLTAALGLGVCGLFSACAPAEGDVKVTVYGESFIEDGIPADEMADGWAVSFDTFDVTITGITVGGVALGGTGTNDVGPNQSGTSALDIAVGTDGAGHPIATGRVPAGDHTGSAYTISRVALVGSAVKDGVTKTFDWTIEAPTAYTACDTTTTVVPGETATFQITVHADHFFYDSLVAEEPNVVFAALAAADADDDGAITQAELEAADIGAYDPGSAGGVDNLWAYLVAQSATLGHVDGEGHCDAEPAS